MKKTPKRPPDPPRVPISREAAMASGFVKYFTGSPCKWGHVDFRYTKTNLCVPCHQRMVYPELKRK